MTAWTWATSCLVLRNTPAQPSISIRRRLYSAFPSLAEGEKETVECLAADILSRENATVGDEGNNELAIRRRIALSKAITLVESKAPAKRLLADALLDELRRHPALRRGDGPSFRLGIAGPPGVGKSTFVEALGLHILGLKGEADWKSRREETCFRPDKLAVLCIDPSSHVTGGSILGDKTRMSNLSCHPRAYVRPSPSSGTLGGLGSYTYDAVSLCELAGYDLTIIETVGVGQSEVELAECCDLFILLLAPGGGDELQGSKKGIVEVADVLVVNKADGETHNLARQTAAEYENAMGLLRKPAGWWGGSEHIIQECELNDTAPTAPPVLLVSARTGFGLSELWNTVLKYQRRAQMSGYLYKKRKQQNKYWMWKYLRQNIVETTQKDPMVRQKAEEIEKSLDCGLVAPRAAAGELWECIVDSGSKQSTG